MKKFYFSVLLLLAGVATFAQYRDPKAKVILDQVSSKFKSYQSASAGFTYQILNSKGKVLSTKKGTVSMKGDKYHISFGANKIISDGNTVWNYDPDAKEVTVNDANKSESTITPQKLFTDFYNKDFNYVLGDDLTISGKKAYRIIMTPADKRKSFERAYLAIDQATKNMVSLLVVEKSGNRFSYSLNNFKPNASVSDGLFRFDKNAHPGVEVVDLR